MSDIPEHIKAEAKAIFVSLPREVQARNRAIARALISAEARGMERAAKRDWRAIETAPLNKAVDLWCVEQDAPATWGNGHPAGEIVRNRHKSEKYGWFGNQSDEGVPRGHKPDLLPVAWRLATPRPPLEMVEAFVSSRRNSTEAPDA